MLLNSNQNNLLNEYFEKGLLYKQTHPTLPLTIWNYSEKVQYESLWDDVTVQCRGLITENTTGKILVRPFTKFFNYEEVVDKNVIPSKGDYVYVQEKMDGSLGILFSYDGEWIMATRGSFTSAQAIKGMEILKRKYPVFNRAWLYEYAYLVEIIYPENRIVVDYGKEKITFLSVVINEGYSYWKLTDESELHWTTARSIMIGNGIKKSDIVKTEQHFNFSDELYQSLKSKNEKNKEGYVLRYQPGNFRMKIKFDDYVRLHKIMTNLSTTAVWEVLSNGQNMDSILKDVPDEFYQKIREYEDKLHCEFRGLKSEYEDHFESIRRLGTRKLFAQFSNVGFMYPKILFAMYDGKSVDAMIWKIIKPEFRKL
jgi:RNA ligase